MSIGDVKTVLFNVVQTFVGIYARHRFSISAQFYSFKRAPRGKLRRQVDSRRVFSTTKHAAWTLKNVNLHILYL